MTSLINRKASRGKEGVEEKRETEEIEQEKDRNRELQTKQLKFLEKHQDK